MDKSQITGCLLVCFLLFTPGYVFAGKLHFRALDVGEGQSILLHMNNRAILVDTGHAGMAVSVLNRLAELGIQQLDYLILTHLHPDHASGYFRIHEQYPQVTTLDNCYPVKAGDTDDMVRWVDAALQSNPHRRCVKRGDKLEWQGIEIAVLWPVEPLSSQSGLNHSSLVLSVNGGKQKLLIMGDADKKAEAKILEIESLHPVDLLVVGHHGANDASSEQFLQKVSPQYSVISTNKENFRGYPSAETLQRLAKFSDKILKTYDSGEIHLILE